MLRPVNNYVIGMLYNPPPAGTRVFNSMSNLDDTIEILAAPLGQDIVKPGDVVVCERFCWTVKEVDGDTFYIFPLDKIKAILE